MPPASDASRCRAAHRAPGTADNAPAGSAGSRSKGARRCASCWRRGVGRCARSGSPRTSTLRRRSTTSSAWRHAARVRLVAVSRTRLERARAHRSAPGRAGARRRPSRSPSSTPCAAARGGGALPARARWCHRPAQRRALCCAARSAPGSPASCCPAIAPRTSPPRSPRWRPGPSSTSTIAVVSGIPNALRRLHDAGVTSVGLDADAGHSLFEVGRDGDGAVALVLGCRGSGARPAHPSPVQCPGCPSRSSARWAALNVAAAGAVACFELARRRVAADGSGAPKPRPRSAAENGQHHGARRPR